MNFAGAAILTVAFLIGGATSSALTRVFAAMLRRQGTEVLGFWERLSARGDGPVAGTRTLFRDDLRIWREMLVHHQAADVEAARLFTWVAYGFTAVVFIAALKLASSYNDESFDYGGAVADASFVVWMAFWITQAVVAGRRRSARWFLASTILAVLALVVKVAH